MADQEDLRKQRSIAKRCFTRARQNLEQAIEGAKEGKEDETFVSSCYERMKERWINVEARHEEYMTDLCGSDDEPPEEEDKWIKNLEKQHKEADQLMFHHREELLKIAPQENLATVSLTVPDTNHSIEKTRAERIYQIEESTLTMGLNGLKELMSAEDATSSSIKDMRDEMKSQFEKWDKARRNLILKSTEDEMESLVERMHALQQEYSDINVKSSRMSASLSKFPTGLNATQHVGDHGLKLERMKLPNFDGAIRSYARFKSDFLNHVMPSIKSSQNACYVLRSCLHGEPRLIISNVDDDLKLMWERLDEKFGKPSKLADTVMNEIKSFKPIQEADDKKFLQFVDTIERGYRDLKAAKLEKEISNTTIVSVIEEKLPRVIRREWCMLVSKRDSKVNEHDKFPHLMEFLLEQKRCIEYSSNTLRQNSSHPSYGKMHHIEIDVDHEVYHLELEEEKKQSKEDELRRKPLRCWIHGSITHETSECRTYNDASPDERLELVNRNKACWCCLKVGHRATQCYKKTECKEGGCKRYHHQSLHKVFVKGEVNNQHHLNQGHECILQLMTIPSAGEVNTKLNALWDGGSTLSMITFKKAKEMQLPGKRVQLTIVKVGGLKETTKSYQYEVPLKDKSGTTVLLYAYGIQRISAPAKPVNMEEITSLFPTVEEDEIIRPLGDIDLLIGYEYAGYHPIVEDKIGHLLLLKNRFGRCIGGSPKSDSTDHNTSGVIMHAAAQVSIDDFYTNESLGVECNPKCGSCRCGECPIGGKQYSLKEERELTMIENNLRLDGCQWTATYPWIKNPNNLPNNYGAAFARLQNTEKRLWKNEFNRQQYQAQIEDMISRGVCRKLSKEEIDIYSGPVHYISHHEVINPNSSSTPCRIVFNSSAKFQNHALNDYWAKGPDLINNLIGVLLRFRENNVAITADIKKMYHSVKISPLDQHTHRFLWRDMQTDQPPDTYVMTSVSFGDKPAGSIAVSALAKTAKSNFDTHPEAATMILNNSYVDDLVDSIGSENAAKQLAKEVDEVLKKGNFSVKGWIFSGIHNDPNEVQRVLGVIWAPHSDNLSIDIKTQKDNTKQTPEATEGQQDSSQTSADKEASTPTKLTKRQILSKVNSIYDPLGFITPVTVRAKILMRRINTEFSNLHWDDPVPDSYREEWEEFFNELTQTKEIKFERVLKPEAAIGNPWLIVFSDASEKAFGACAYVRWTLADGSHWTRLIMAKTRLAPLKKITIVRLELNAALLAKRIKVTIEKESRFEFERVYFIVDSEIVRAMIQRQSYGFNTFAGVRVGEIQASTDPKDWYWIEGSENIADVLTRGNKQPDELKKDGIWQNGPLFLRSDHHGWPLKSSFSGETVPDQLPTCNHQDASVHPIKEVSKVVDATRFSSYKKLINVTARILSIAKSRSFKAAKSINEDDVIEAENTWIEDAQQSLMEQFNKGAYDRLSAEKRNGIIVVGKRMENWLSSSYDNRHPVLLPFNHPMSKLYVMCEHNRSHQGIAAITAKVRRKFWILQLPKMIKSIKFKCSMCKILNKNSETQVMGPLPLERMKPAPAWSFTSLDIFGPYEIKGETNKRSRSKGYGIIFNCMLSRAIHLDLAPDYSTDAFLLVVKRFISMRGCPKKMRSDHGSQIVAASKELKTILHQHDIKKLDQMASANSFAWEFSSPDAPWKNGCSEALIKSTKKALSLAIGAQVLTFSEMQTVLFEAANLLNERPIGRHPTHPDDGAYLCPNDLLLGRATAINPMNPLAETDDSYKRHTLVLQITDAFWRKWTRDYFPSLIIQQKWHTEKRNVCNGDVVMVQDSNQLRSTWKLGRVSRASPDSDGRVRQVDIEYKRENSRTFTTITRPVQRIVVVVPANESL